MAALGAVIWLLGDHCIAAGGSTKKSGDCQPGGNGISPADGNAARIIDIYIDKIKGCSLMRTALLNGCLERRDQPFVRDSSRRVSITLFPPLPK